MAEKVRVLISTGEVSNNKAVPVGDIDAKTSVGWGYGWGFGNCVATFQSARLSFDQGALGRAGFGSC